MTERVDHVVVGLGAIGSAACWALADGSRSVLGLEQFEVGHARGASHDHSRIIRRSYHTPGYVALAGAAYDAWARVERDAGEVLVVRTGGLDLFPHGAAIPMEDYTASMAALGVPFDVLDAAAVQRRWPQWQLDPGVHALYQADTGIVAAARATAALRRVAETRGAQVRGETSVFALEPRGERVLVRTDAGDIDAGTVTLALDAWVNELLAPLGTELPVVVTQEQLTYTQPADIADYAPGRFPVWIWMDDPSFYGFPEFGEPGWVKAAEDCGGREVTARTRTFDADPVAEHRLLSFLEHALPGASVGPTRTTTCLYTLTPDRDFVLDRLAAHPSITVALGAAHGFKFAARFGEILRDLALGRAVDHDLTPFRIDRPALTAGNADRAWLV